MTKKEYFEKATGLRVTDMFYGAFIAALDTEGTEEWMRRHEGMTQRLMDALADDTHKFLTAVKAEREAARRVREQLDALYARLAGFAAEMDDEGEIRSICVERFGWNGYLARKLRAGGALLEDERRRLAAILEENGEERRGEAADA